MYYIQFINRLWVKSNHCLPVVEKYLRTLQMYEWIGLYANFVHIVKWIAICQHIVPMHVPWKNMYYSLLSVVWKHQSKVSPDTQRIKKAHPCTKWTTKRIFHSRSFVWGTDNIPLQRVSEDWLGTRGSVTVWSLLTPCSFLILIQLEIWIVTVILPSRWIKMVLF